MMMMMRMRRMGTSLGLLLLGLVVTSAAAGPGSCSGRCGEVFTRGQQCSCDFSCLQHNECCQDFRATCITARSCQGRCGETFRRGQSCECDPMCIRYNTCCHDYQRHCDVGMSVSQQGSLQFPRAPASASASGKRNSKKSRKKSNSDSEEWYSAFRNPLTAGSTGSAPPALPTNHLHHGGSIMPAGLMPIPSSNSRTPYYPAAGSSLPRQSAPSRGSAAPVGPSTAGAVGGNVNVHLVLSPVGVAPSAPNRGVGGPAGSRTSTLQDVAQGLGLPAVEGGPVGPAAGIFADVDLCSDSTINGLTALTNGTILIFKGEVFWSVDPVSRSAGRPQSITETLGVSSPIDTVFTRSNCHGNTYITKGDQCWRLDGNMVVEPGYPRPLASEFPGLTGSVSAALSVPATRDRLETVFFFKTGDIMQKFTFPPGSTPSCSEKPRSSLKGLLAPLAEALLSAEINIKVSMKGFPTPVTSALSTPGPQGSNTYQHFVFSGPLFFSIQISSELPELAEPEPSAVFAPLPILNLAAVETNPANMAAQNLPPLHPANSIRVWLRCP